MSRISTTLSFTVNPHFLAAFRKLSTMRLGNDGADAYWLAKSRSIIESEAKMYQTTYLDLATKHGGKPSATGRIDFGNQELMQAFQAEVMELNNKPVELCLNRKVVIHPGTTSESGESFTANDLFVLEASGIAEIIPPPDSPPGV